MLQVGNAFAKGKTPGKLHEADQIATAVTTVAIEQILAGIDIAGRPHAVDYGGGAALARARHRRDHVHLQRDLWGLISPYPYAKTNEIWAPEIRDSKNPKNSRGVFLPYEFKELQKLPGFWWSRRRPTLSRITDDT